MAWNNSNVLSSSYGDQSTKIKLSAELHCFLGPSGESVAWLVLAVKDCPQSGAPDTLPSSKPVITSFPSWLHIFFSDCETFDSLVLDPCDCVGPIWLIQDEISRYLTESHQQSPTHTRVLRMWGSLLCLTEAPVTTMAVTYWVELQNFLDLKACHVRDEETKTQWWIMLSGIKTQVLDP